MDAIALPSLPPATAPATARPGRIKDVSTEFEAAMLTPMLESMFTGVDTGGLFGGGQSEGVWRSFMLREYGKAIAESGALGIGRMVHAEVARLYQAQGIEP